MAELNEGWPLCLKLGLNESGLRVKLFREWEKVTTPAEFEDRLRQLKVLKIEVRSSVWCQAAIEDVEVGIIPPGKKGYCIVLDATRFSEWMEDFGHELAHLEAWRLGGETRPGSPEHKFEHEFAEGFGQYWAKMPQHQEAVRLFLSKLIPNTNVYLERPS